MSDGKLIYELIPKLVEDADAIAKDRRNESQNFLYRGIDDVMNMVHPILVKHKVFVTTKVEEAFRENRQTKSGGTSFHVVLKVLFTFYASDGSFVQSVIEGEGMDSGDKATPKALSIAYKYAMFQLLCIPTQLDPDADTPEETVRRVLSQRDRQFIEDTIAKFDSAKNAVELKQIGVTLADEPQEIRDELKAIYSARMKSFQQDDSLAMAGAK